MQHIKQQNILTSACLLGSPVRYNGTDLLIDHPLIKKWKRQERLISFCPEVAGGLPVPRPPAEITNGDGSLVLEEKASVIDANNNDMSKTFIRGAKEALKIAQQHNCVAAVLTERSPSCGSTLIYDGSFSGVRKEGMGVTASLLTQNNIRVFNQHQLEALNTFLKIKDSQI